MNSLARAFRAPQTREGRNEQRKLRGALFNALAITMIVAALVGPFVNPVLSSTLTLPDRILIAVGGWMFHLLARRMVRDMEDK